jgi:TIR domain
VRVFLSHSTRDRPIAEALKHLLEAVFGKRRVVVEFSSDQQAGGGIPPGAQWLPWITERITRADRTYVMLTPNSMKKPWVLWESGAAAGVALAKNKASRVIPITFGIRDADIPSPFQSTQRVLGDTDTADGITRLLQDINKALSKPLTEKVLASTRRQFVPDFLAKVKMALEESPSTKTLLAAVPPSFSADRLNGFWVTCYRYDSGHGLRCHADISQVKHESERRVTIRNYPPEPRTQDRKVPFRNDIHARLANRHLIGLWRNINDTRYFGSIHLAVLSSDTVMEGYYTVFLGDVQVGCEPWKWVRLDPASLLGVDLSQVTLREPDVLHALVQEHLDDAGPMALADVVEGT